MGKGESEQDSSYAEIRVNDVPSHMNCGGLGFAFKANCFNSASQGRYEVMRVATDYRVGFSFSA